MMDVADLLKPEDVLIGLRVPDKARLLQELARRAAAATGADAAALVAALMARERLGSTGLGRGFALPHARIDGLAQVFGLLARLAKPIDFEAIDAQPVDLVFLVLVPADAAGAHLAALSAVSRQMRDAALVQRVRRADSPAAVFALVAGTDKA